MHDGRTALDAFYASPRGAAAARLIRTALRRLWPSVSGLSLLGLGCTEPYLRPFLSEAARIAAVSLPEQGARAWPPGRASLAALAEDTALPFADRSFDRVLMVHALEASEHSRRTMREVWRVMQDGGRLVVVVPNRRGMWAHLEATPFGHGRPYSAGQLRRLCQAQMFMPLRQEELLFVPPFPWRPLLRGARAWDAAGRMLCPGFAGLLVLEAEKTVLAPLTVEEAAPVRRTAMVEAG